MASIILFSTLSIKAMTCNMNFIIILLKNYFEMWLFNNTAINNISMCKYYLQAWLYQNY